MTPKLFDFLLRDAGNYESRVVGRTDVNGLTVSTAHTPDEGYETAIIDINGVHPVERYKNREQAELGHAKWCKDANDLTNITRLGWNVVGLEDTYVKLERYLY